MCTFAWRWAVLGVGALLLTTTTASAQSTSRFDGGASTFTLGFNPEDQAATEEVHHRRFYGGYYGGFYSYRPAFYGHSHSFYRSPFVSHSFYSAPVVSFYRPPIVSYGFYQPYVYRPAFYGYSYYPGFCPISGGLDAVPTVALRVQVAQPDVGNSESSSSPLQRVPKTPAPQAQPQTPPPPLPQPPQPLPQGQPPIPPIPQDPQSQQRTYPYDGGPSNPVPMPESATEPLRQPVRPMLPTDGRPVSLPARQVPAKKYTYPAYGEKLTPKDPTLISVSGKK